MRAREPGLIETHFSDLYGKVTSRMKQLMSQWSRSTQAEEVARAEADCGWGAHWAIDDDDFINWETSDDTVVVNVVRADDETADTIAAALVAKLRVLAEGHIAASGKPYYFELSTVMRIEMRFEFLNEFTMDEDDQFLPMPKEGLPLSAEVILVPRHRPHFASPRR